MMSIVYEVYEELLFGNLSIMIKSIAKYETVIIKLLSVYNSRPLN